MAALVITPEIEADLQRLVERTGKTPTEVMADALQKHLENYPIRASKNVEKIRELIRQFPEAPVDLSLTEDEILGYDEDGIPEQPCLGR